MKVWVLVVGLAALGAALSSTTRGFATGGFPASGSTDTTICPPDRADTRKVVSNFFVKTPDVRAELGLTLADTASLRVLTDSTDAAACQWFWSEVSISADPPSDWAFYRAGAFYFVSIVHAPQCQICLRHDALAIFDSTFALRKMLGM